MDDLLAFWLRPFVDWFAGRINNFQDVGLRNGVAAAGQRGQAVNMVV